MCVCVVGGGASVVLQVGCQRDKGQHAVSVIITSLPLTTNLKCTWYGSARDYWPLTVLASAPRQNVVLKHCGPTHSKILVPCLLLISISEVGTYASMQHLSLHQQIKSNAHSISRNLQASPPPPPLQGATRAVHFVLE